MGGAGIALTLGAVYWGAGEIYQVYERLRPIFAVSDDGYRAVLDHWLKPPPEGIWHCGLPPDCVDTVRAGAAGIVALVATPMPEAEAAAARANVALQHVVADTVRERHAAPETT